MNGRKRAFTKGLKALRAGRSRRMTRRTGTICAIRPRLYDAAGMPEANQIIQGDSIKVLNEGPEGWVDLVFADPPFNIGYGYDVYDDRRDSDQYWYAPDVGFYVKWIGRRGESQFEEQLREYHRAPRLTPGPASTGSVGAPRGGT